MRVADGPENQLALIGFETAEHVLQEPAAEETSKFVGFLEQEQSRARCFAGDR